MVPSIEEEFFGVSRLGHLADKGSVGHSFSTASAQCRQPRAHSLHQLLLLLKTIEYLFVYSVILSIYFIFPE